MTGLHQTQLSIHLRARIYGAATLHGIFDGNFLWFVAVRERVFCANICKWATFTTHTTIRYRKCNQKRERSHHHEVGASATSMPQ